MTIKASNHNFENPAKIFKLKNVHKLYCKVTKKLELSSFSIVCYHIHQPAGQSRQKRCGKPVPLSNIPFNCHFPKPFFVIRKLNHAVFFMEK